MVFSKIFDQGFQQIYGIGGSGSTPVTYLSEANALDQEVVNGSGADCIEIAPNKI